MGPIFIFGPANRRKKRIPSSNKTTPARHRAESTRGERPATTCKQEVDFLDRYLSADLNGRELAKFERHLEVCRDCVTFLQTYKTTIRLTRSYLSSQTPARPSHDFSLKRPIGRAKRR